METVFMPVEAEVGSSPETESDKPFMTMLIDSGAHTCNMMLTKPNGQNRVGSIRADHPLEQN
eukprot:11124401-Heterocapsa_arctica.AAC.1